MSRKIPEDAFERYVALGERRSYQVLALDLGVSKRAVSKCAAREKWTERLTKIERTARERSDQKITETIEQMRERHIVTVKIIHARALTGLKQFPIDNAMDAVRAAELAIKLERLVKGDSTERSEMTIEEITKRELRAWLIPPKASEPEPDGESEGGGDDDH